VPRVKLTRGGRVALFLLRLYLIALLGLLVVRFARLGH
jgi:hypothetical protein